MVAHPDRGAGLKIVLIEQAIFASDQTCPHDGQPMVAYSPGIEDLDRREIALCSPAHAALWEHGADAGNVDFFRLPSGCYCISQSTLAGEHKLRRGTRVYTQFLVADAEALAAFSNNALALLATAFAQGHVRVLEQVPADLEPFRLCGRAVAVDEAALGGLVSDPGVTWLQALVEAALSAPQIALLAPQHAQRLIAGLINCLPVECRLDFSFSTGLKYSARRPFRIVCLGGDLADQRRLAQRYGLTVVEVSGKPPTELTAATGWGGLVANSLAAGKTTFLAEQLSIARPGLTLPALGQLGNQLLELLAAEVSTPNAAVRRQATSGEEVLASAMANDADARRADAAHFRFAGWARASADAAKDDWQTDPSHIVGNACPAAIEKLEMLDDLVFESIAGKPGALAALRRLWPEVLAQVGPTLVEESREQYLRHALGVWKECVDGEQIRNPALALATMEVICLLFGDG